jgi:hypothetical protein
MAVTDSFTSTRVCCTCTDMNYCPFAPSPVESAKYAAIPATSPVPHTCSVLRARARPTPSLISTHHQHRCHPTPVLHFQLSIILRTLHLLARSVPLTPSHDVCARYMTDIIVRAASTCERSYRGGPIPRDESTYCPHECTSATCRQLAAGCGVSLYDLAGQANGGDGDWYVGRRDRTHWGEHACSQQQIVQGRCDTCTMPYWCATNARLTSCDHLNLMRAACCTRCPVAFVVPTRPCTDRAALHQRCSHTAHRHNKWPLLEPLLSSPVHTV